MGDNFPDIIQWRKDLTKITKFLRRIPYLYKNYFGIIYYYYEIEQKKYDSVFINIWKKIILRDQHAEACLITVFKVSSCFKKSDNFTFLVAMQVYLKLQKMRITNYVFESPVLKVIWKVICNEKWSISTFPRFCHLWFKLFIVYSLL